MRFNRQVEQTIRHYEASVGDLLRFYLDKRLQVYGRDVPDFQDLQSSRSKALVSLCPDSNVTFDMDADAIKERCDDSDPSHWLSPGDISRAIQGHCT